MSDTLTPPGDESDTGGPPQPMAQAPGGPPGAGPPGGGGMSPIMAAIARARMGPRPSQPGMGTQAGALQKIAMATDLLTQALSALPQGSSHRKGVLTALTHLDRMHGGNQPPVGAQGTAIQDMLRNNQRNAILQRLLAQGGGGGGGGGGQGPPPGMSPSTPMPGA